MQRRAIRGLFAAAVAAGFVGILPADDATAHNCALVEVHSPTSTTLGDPNCRPHDLDTHDCSTTGLAVVTVVECVENP